MPTYGEEKLILDIGKMKYILEYTLFESKSMDLPNLSEIKIISIDIIKGENKWSNDKDKLVHMVIDLGEWENFPSNKIPNFYQNIKKYLPSMKYHRCSEGRKNGFFFRVKEGTWIGHIAEHIALELQTLAGYDVGFGRTRQTKKKGQYNVVFNYEDEKIGIKAAKESIKVIKMLIQNKDLNINNIIKKIKSK
jgi:cyanophycin synthetase